MIPQDKVPAHTTTDSTTSRPEGDTDKAGTAGAHQDELTAVVIGAHFISSPGRFWDALLKMTKIKLELLTDIGIQLLIEKGLRGGISIGSKKFAKVNNPQCLDSDNSKSNNWLLNLNANNLCLVYESISASRRIPVG